MEEFDAAKRAVAVVELVVLAAGATLNCGLIYAVVRERLYRRKIDQAALVEISGSALFCTFFFATFVTTLANGGFSGPTGFMVCQLQGLTINIFMGLLLAGHFLLARERYTKIVLERELTGWEFVTTIAALIGTLAVCSAVEWPNFVHFEGGTQCFYNFTSDDARVLVPSIVATSWCIFITMGVFVFYVQIYRHAGDIFSNMRKVATMTIRDGGSGATGDKGSESKTDDTRSHDKEAGRSASIHHSTRQRMLLFRCLTILMVFVALYTPAFILLIARLVTRRLVPPWAQIATSLLAVFDSILSPIVFTVLNHEYRSAVRRHILRVRE